MACPKGLLPSRCKGQRVTPSMLEYRMLGHQGGALLHPTRAGGRDSQSRDLEKIPCSQACHCQTVRKTTAAGKPRQPSPTRRAWSVSPAPSLSAASVTPTLQLEETPCPPPTPSPPPPVVPVPAGGPRRVPPGMFRPLPWSARGVLSLLSPGRVCLLSGLLRCKALENSPQPDPGGCGLSQSPARRDAVQGWDGFGGIWIPPSGCRDSTQATGPLFTR